MMTVMTALGFEASRPKALTEIPQPCGWRVLVAMLPVETKSAGGILLPDSHLDKTQAVATVGYIIALGPQAYQRADTGLKPWVFPGNRVLVAKYAGQRHDTRAGSGNVELRIINDDEVQAVFSPSGEAPDWVADLIAAALE
jgi:co-chaperonin GroES (HSP10)